MVSNTSYATFFSIISNRIFQGYHIVCTVFVLIHVLHKNKYLNIWLYWVVLKILERLTWNQLHIGIFDIGAQTEFQLDNTDTWALKLKYTCQTTAFFQFSKVKTTRQYLQFNKYSSDIGITLRNRELIWRKPSQAVYQYKLHWIYLDPWSCKTQIMINWACALGAVKCKSRCNNYL